MDEERIKQLLEMAAQRDLQVGVNLWPSILEQLQQSAEIERRSWQTRVWPPLKRTMRLVVGTGILLILVTSFVIWIALLRNNASPAGNPTAEMVIPPVTTVTETIPPSQTPQPTATATTQPTDTVIPRPTATSTPTPVAPSAGGLPTGRIAFVSYRDGNAEIYAIRPDGSELVRLTEDPQNDVQPACSPDGSQIAFTSGRDGNLEIYTINSDGTELTRLTVDPGEDAAPGWSPDGSQIAFSSMRSGNFHIWTMDADGSNLQQLTSGTDVDQSPRWLPNGESLVFLRLSETGYRYVTLEVSSGEAEPLNLTNLPSEAQQLVWSPDRTQVAFHWAQGGEPDIWALDVSNGELRQLTDHPAADVEPSWSPDGAFIAFTSMRDDNAEIYLMRADGSELSRLTDDPAHDLSPSWGMCG